MALGKDTFEGWWREKPEDPQILGKIGHVQQNTIAPVRMRVNTNDDCGI